MRLSILAFLFGILLCLSFPDLPIYLSTIIFWAIVSWKFPYFRYLLVICLGYIWTLWRVDLILANTLPTEIEGQDVIVVGHIVDLPQKIGKKWQFLFEPSQLIFKKQHYDFTGKIRLAWYENKHELRPNQQWQLTVRLKKPHVTLNFGVRDYSTILLAQRIRAVGYVRDPHSAKLLRASYDWHIDSWRYRLSDAIYTKLPNNKTTHLLVALAVGDQRAILPQQYQVLQYTGTIHLMSISGLHISLVTIVSIGFFKLLFRRLRLYPSRYALKIPTPQIEIMLGLFFAFVYSLIAGFSIPTQRSFIMIAALTVIFMLKRRIGTSYILSFALFCVLILDPLSVHSQGFWLSFGVIALLGYAFSSRSGEQISAKNQAIPGYIALIKNKSQFTENVFFQLEQIHSKQIRTHSTIAWYINALNYMRFKPEQPKINWIKSIIWLLFPFYFKILNAIGIKQFKAQWAVTLGISPAILSIFGYISWTTMVANAIAIPVVGIIVVPSVLLGTLFILPFPTLGVMILTVSAYIMESLWFFLTWLAQFGVWKWTMPPFWTVIIATIGALIILLPRGFPSRWVGIIWLLPLFFVTYPRPQPGELWFTLLDVGQGLAVVIRTQHHTMLYDTGIKIGDFLDSGSTIIVPFLKAQSIQHIDRLIISHADRDHSGGLNSIVAVMPVTQILTSDVKKLRSILPDYPMQSCQAGQHWEIDGIRFDILSPTPNYIPESNNRSCVLKVSVGKHAILLPGDIGEVTEKQLIKSNPNQLRADVLIVPHHGSRTSSTESFIDKVNPEIALFSVGYKNQFGFPKQEIMKRYKSRQIFTLETPQTAAIEFSMTKEGIFNLRFASREMHRYWHE